MFTIHHFYQVLCGLDPVIVVMVFNFWMNIIIHQFCEIDKNEFPIHIIFFQNSIYSFLMASRDLYIVYKNTEFPVNKAFINIISIIGNQCDPFFEAHIPIILDISLLSVYLSFYATCPIIFK